MASERRVLCTAKVSVERPSVTISASISLRKESRQVNFSQGGVRAGLDADLDTDLAR